MEGFLNTSISEARITAFNGIRPEPVGALTLAQAAGAIRTDADLAAFTAEARRILTDVGKDAYNAFKTDARAVTWAGEFKHRDERSLITPSGLAFIDFDGDDRAEAEAERARVSAYPFTAAAYLSLSGGGVHAIIRVDPPPATPAEYKAAWSAAMRATGYAKGGEFKDADQSVKNLSRVCFIASDPDAYFDPDASALAWDTEAEAEAPTPGGREWRGEREYQRRKRHGARGIDLSLIDLSFLPLHISADDEPMYEGVIRNLAALDSTNGLASGSAYAEQYRAMVAAAYPGGSRHAVDRLARLPADTDRAAAFAKILAKQQDGGWQYPKRARGRPGASRRIADFVERAQAQGIANAKRLAPTLAVETEVERAYHYALDRFLLVRGYPDQSRIQIADDVGFYHDLNALSAVSRNAVQDMLRACREAAAAELRGIADDWGREAAAKLAESPDLQDALLQEVMKTLCNTDYRYPAVDADAFNRRRTGYLPMAGGVWDICAETLITDVARIRAMRIAAPAYQMPPPNFGVLNDPQTRGGRLMREAIQTRYGADTMRRAALGLLTAGKFAFVVQAPKYAGKTLLLTLWGLAYCGKPNVQQHKNFGKRFDGLEAKLKDYLFASIDQASDLGGRLQAALFDATQPTITLERKFQDAAEVWRLGTLMVGTTEDLDIDFDAQGLTDRIGVIAQFTQQSAMPERMALPLYGDRDQPDAVEYLRAYGLREAGALARANLTADGAIDINGCDEWTHSADGTDALNEMAARAQPHIQALRALYERSRGEWTYADDLYAVLSENGVRDKKSSPVVAKMIRAAFGFDNGVKALLRTPEGESKRARCWEVRLRDKPLDDEPPPAATPAGDALEPSAEAPSATPDAFAAIPRIQIDRWRGMGGEALAAELAAHRAAGDADAVAAIERIQAGREAAAGFADMRKPHRTD